MTLAASPELDTLPLFANRKHWTRDDCDFLERAGLLTERYELLDGEIIIKMGQNRPHIMSTIRVIGWLLRTFSEERVQTQDDIEVAGPDQPTNRPQPDAAVLSRPDYEFTEPPRGADLLLGVEVSDTTLRDDLRTKAALYARAGIPEYWVFDVKARRLHIHRDAQNGVYQTVTTHNEQETVTTQAAPNNPVRVGDLLPPAPATN